MTDRERLIVLERHRNHYALVNMLLRQGNIAGLKTLGYDDAEIARLKEPDARGRIGYAQALTSARDKIRKLRKRISK